MVTTLAGVETREVVRCDFCSLVQYRTTNSLCRKCRRPLDIEEPAPLAPQLVSTPQSAASTEAGLQVAAQVREIRRARHMSQLVRDSRSRREEEVAAILSDPFLAEIASMLPYLDSLHRTLLYGSVRDMAMGRRRTA